MTIGPEYEGSSKKRRLLGNGYRDLWTTPVNLEVLDLRKEGGGLTPFKKVGQAQSVSLALNGPDGRSYTFRSLHKEPERMLPDALRNGMPGYIVKDMTSLTHPAAGVIFPVIADAAGVPHTWTRMVVMPDDPALGTFRETFANLAGTFEEYPLPAKGDKPGFMGATEIVSSLNMWKKWMEGPENRLDSRAYLRSRVIELLVDNYDRHKGQWRWMKIPGKDAWQPLPEDPDFVFIHRDGILMMVARRQAPQFLEFKEEFPGRLDGALRAGAEMDRWVLSDLTAKDFEEVARDVQSRLTDEVFERALRQMPPEWYAIDGAHTLSSLRARRPHLVEYLNRVYRYHAHSVDVHATDRNERVTVARAPDDSVEISIALADRAAAPHYRRRFLPSETQEVRVFLHGGDDYVERTGRAGGPITVRVIAGGGHDVIDDAKSGGTDAWRDAGTMDVRRGPGTNVRNTPWINPAPVKDKDEVVPWIEPRSFTQWTVPTPLFGYAPDVLVYAGYGFTRTSWGFRTLPNKSVQTLQGAFATGELTGQVEYVGTFRRPGTRLGYELTGYAGGLKHYNYFGAGNETPRVTDRSAYKTHQDVISFVPALHFEAGQGFAAHVGPEVRYSQTPTDTTTVVASEKPLGVGHFGLLGVVGGLSFDSRQPLVPRVNADVTNNSTPFGEEPHLNGVRLETSAFFVPKAWSVDSGYGGLDAFVATYLGGEHGRLALRVGGRKLWGSYPWFDAAYIGGADNRGFNRHRFAGDASLYSNASVHVWLPAIGNRVMPFRIGVLGLGDVGRVWLDGENSKKWHSSFGGGILVQPLGMPLVVNLVAAHSSEGTHAYFGFGYPF
ncbi:MAG: hypothetical protein ACM3NQ_24140 [Bacteroidales bacterium]